MGDVPSLSPQAQTFGELCKQSEVSGGKARAKMPWRRGCLRLGGLQAALSSGPDDMLAWRLVSSTQLEDPLWGLPGGALPGSLSIWTKS